MTTIAPKTTSLTTKRSAGQTRVNSDDSRSSSSVSIIVGGNLQESINPEPLKIITEVDGK